MKKLLKDILKFIQVLLPQTITADTSTTGVNTADFNALTFLVNVGTFTFTGVNKLDLFIQDSDVDVDGSYALTADANMLYGPSGVAFEATGKAKILDSTDDQNTVHLLHYRGEKKFARVRMVEGGTVSCIIGVTAVNGHPEFKPPL